MNNKVLATLLCTTLALSFPLVGEASITLGEKKNIYVTQKPEPENKNTTSEEETAAEVTTAEEPVMPQISLQKDYVLTLEEAINMAVTDNPQFLNYDTAIEDAKVQADKAKKNMKDAEKIVPRLPSGIDTLALKKGYYVEAALFNISSNETEKKQAESKLAYNVTQQYYNVKLTEALLNCAKNAYDAALTNKNTIDTKFSLGLVPELEVKNAQLALDQAKAGCESCERGLALAIEQLKISLQLDQTDSTLTLTDGIEYEEFTTNLKVDEDKAVENRFDMFKLKKSLDLALLYRDCTDVFGESLSSSSSTNKNVSQAQYLYDNSAKLVRLGIKSGYNDIINAKSDFELATRKAALAQQEYDVAKLKYDLGLITNSELTTKMNAIATALKDVENAKLTHKLAVKKYSYEISIGL